MGTDKEILTKILTKLVIWILHIKLLTLWMLKNVVKTMLTVSLEANILQPKLGLEEEEILGGGLPNVSSARLSDIRKMSAQWTKIAFGVNTVKRGSITHTNFVLKIKIKINLRRILRIKRTQKIQRLNRGKEDKLGRSIQEMMMKSQRMRMTRMTIQLISSA